LARLDPDGGIIGGALYGQDYAGVTCDLASSGGEAGYGAAIGAQGKVWNVLTAVQHEFNIVIRLTWMCNQARGVGAEPLWEMYL